MEKVQPEKLKRLYNIPTHYLMDVMDWMDREYTDALEDLSDCPVEEVMVAQGKVKGIKKLRDDLTDVRNTKKDFK